VQWGDIRRVSELFGNMSKSDRLMLDSQLSLPHGTKKEIKEYKQKHV